MSGSITALVIAIVGVLGTLSASIVSQKLSVNARREEFELQRLQRRDEYEREVERTLLSDKRACYIAMTATSRRYRVELMNYLHMVKRGTVGEGAKGELEEARRTYITGLAETQMTATLSVLEAIEPVTSGLSKAYRATKQLEEGDPEPDGSFEEIRVFLLELWDRWRDMRTAMRNDLGVRD